MAHQSRRRIGSGKVLVSILKLRMRRTVIKTIIILSIEHYDINKAIHTEETF